MNEIVAAIAMALNTTVGAIIVPENEHPITWVFAECRAVDAASGELEVDILTPEHSAFDRWKSHFWNLAEVVFEDTYEVSAAGKGREHAMALISKQLVLGKLNAENWNDRIAACAISYEAMTMVIAEF